jgi:SAM-dependent methyltransferase
MTPSSPPAPDALGTPPTPIGPDAIGAANFFGRADVEAVAAAALEPYGGPTGLWMGVLLPRLCRFLPAAHALEIGCGAGLLAERLIPLARGYTGVDVSDRALACCRRRLGDRPGVRLVQSDGRSLPGVPGASVDLCVSFDALTGASPDTLAALLGELARVLAHAGVALIHTSNLGEHVEELTAAAPGGVLDMQSPVLAGRDPRCTGAALIESARGAGLRVLAQELFDPSGLGLVSDALTLLARDGSGVGPGPVFRRHDWALVRRECRRLAEHYRPVPHAP